MGAIQFIVVLVAGVGGWLAALLTWRANKRASDQKEVQTSREEWWRRFAWATELALDVEPKRARAGRQLIGGLARSGLPAATNWSLCWTWRINSRPTASTRRLIRHILTVMSRGRGDMTEYEFETRILWARLAVEVGQKLGRETPADLRELAAMPLRREAAEQNR